MKKLSIVVAILAPLLMAAQCDPGKVNVRESCEVLKKTLYRDGKFPFTNAELGALSEINQNKIIAIKNYYRDNCLKKA